MKILLSRMSNKELLDLYGYEPYEGSTVASRWSELTVKWTHLHSRELGHLRQIMLQIHFDVCHDERWM